MSNSTEATTTNETEQIERIIDNEEDCRDCLSFIFMIAVSIILSKNTDAKGNCGAVWEYLLTVMLLDILSACFTSTQVRRVIFHSNTEQPQESYYRTTHVIPVSGLIGIVWGIYVIVHYKNSCMNSYRENLMFMFWVAFGYSILGVIWYLKSYGKRSINQIHQMQQSEEV